jgi:hypothetical protein
MRPEHDFEEKFRARTERECFFGLSEIALPALLGSTFLGASTAGGLGGLIGTGITGLGSTLGLGSLGGMTIGGIAADALGGAGLGALTSAATGGNVGKGAEFGALGGAVTGGLSSALGGTGGAAATGTGTAAGGGGAAAITPTASGSFPVSSFADPTVAAPSASDVAGQLNLGAGVGGGGITGFDVPGTYGGYATVPGGAISPTSASTAMAPGGGTLGADTGTASPYDTLSPTGSFGALTPTAPTSALDTTGTFTAPSGTFNTVPGAPPTPTAATAPAATTTDTGPLPQVVPTAPSISPNVPFTPDANALNLNAQGLAIPSQQQLTAGLTDTTGGASGGGAGAGGAAPSSLKTFWDNPTWANAGNIVASNPGAVANALLLGYDQFKGSNVKGLNALKAEAASQQQQSKALENYLNTDTLPGGLQAGLTKSLQDAQQQIKSKYASMGMSGSSAEASDLAYAKVANDAQKGQYQIDLLQAGIQEAGMSAADLKDIININQTQSNAIMNQWGQFFTALGGGTPVKLNTQATSGT